MDKKPRLLRITTVPISLKLLLSGQFEYFSQQGFEILTVSANGKEREDLLAENIRHEIVPMTRTINPFMDLWCLACLVRVIITFKPDIVHTHTPKAGLLGMLAAWICRVKVRMHTVAGLPLMEARSIKRLLLELTEHITYFCATRVYPNSAGLLDFIKKTFPAYSSKYKIIGRGSSNGIDANLFLRTDSLEQESRILRKQYSIKDDEIVFCFVGRVVRDKGIVELTDAFRNMNANITCRLLVVGSFEQALDPLPVETLNYLQTSKQVVLAGFQKDIRPWIIASDVFVFPSYREGFPNVVMQAACLEVPVIASDINGCNEIIQHERTGYIVPVKNVELLTDAMQKVIDDLPTARSMGHKARDFVAANFSREYVWRELLNEYQLLLARV